MATSLIGRLLNRAPVDVGRNTSLLLAPTRPRPGTSSALTAMGSQSTLFAIVDRIATSVGAATWRLYRTAPNGNPDDRQPVTRHPALTVWLKPNPHHNHAEFVEATSQHFDLVGEMPWIVARSTRAPQGPPTELWTVRPDRIRPVASRTEFISGWIYGHGIDETPLRTDQVIFTKRPHPADPYRGIGPVGSLLMDLEGEQAAAEFNTTFFRNGAEPGGLIKTDRTLSDEEFATLVERWNQQHKGVGNAHRVGILENAEWHERKWSARDMQFEQLRRFSRETFRQAFAFPKPLLGDVEDVNRANAEAADVVFTKYLVKPRLNRIRDTLNTSFLPMFGTLGAGVEFDYDDPTPPDKAEERLDLRNRADIAVNMTTAGFDAQQVLAWLRLPDLDYDAPVFVTGTTPTDDDESGDDPENPSE